MLNFRQIEFELEETPGRVLSRLKWVVEIVESLNWSLFSSHTIDTSKKWVGVIDPEKNLFKLTEPMPFFSADRLVNLKFFQFVIRGKIEYSNNISYLKVCVRPGIYTVCLLVLYTMLMALIVGKTIIDQRVDIGILAFFGLFGIVSLFLLNLQLNKIENRLIEVFDLEGP